MRAICFVLFLFFSGVSAFASPMSESVIDHVRSVSSPSASSFQAGMYKNVLGSNYQLKAHSYGLASSRLFRVVAGSEPLLREFISERVYELCRARNVEISRCGDVRADILVSRDYWSVSVEERSHAFASWLFALDGDNWFPLADAKVETDAYLGVPERSLVMLAGFNPDGILVDLLSSNGLPVVLDAAEETITIWTNELAD